MPTVRKHQVKFLSTCVVKAHAPIEDAMESHCGRTILGFGGSDSRLRSFGQKTLWQRDRFVIGLYQTGKLFHTCHSDGFGSVLPGRRNRSFRSPHHSQGRPRRLLVAKLTVAGRWTVYHLLSALEMKELPKKYNSAGLLEKFAKWTCPLCLGCIMAILRGQSNRRWPLGHLSHVSVP